MTAARNPKSSAGRPALGLGDSVNQANHPPDRPRQRGARVVVLQEENDNFCGAWIDRITVSRTTRGHFSVVSAKGHLNRNGSSVSRWATWNDPIRGIKAPGDLAKALEDAGGAMGVEVEWDEVLEHLARVDWVAAAVIAAHRSAQIPALLSADQLLEQRSFRRFGKVTLSVEWGYDMHDLTLSFEQWIRILAGESFTKRSHYYYEGSRFTADWRFEPAREDQLIVGYDDGGTGWIGSLSAIDVIEGPHLEGVDLALLALRAGGLFGLED